MSDFNKIIEAALKEGRSIEDIAKEMSEALNEAQKPKVTPLEEYLDSLQAQIDDAMANEQFELDDAIALVTVCVVENHPDWSLEAVQTFEEGIRTSIESAEMLTDSLGKGSDFFETVGSILDNMFNKSKKSGHRSDDEVIRKFLGDLGM